jgi:molecular chaperone DnaK (HSP70)
MIAPRPAPTRLRSSSPTRRGPWWSKTGLSIPSLDVEAHVTREQFEAAARPLVARTVRATAAVLRTENVPSDRIAGLFLVGGSTRIPLVATLLFQELRISPTVLEQPEIVVAEGALHHIGARLPSGT